jgi:hypothetical protein
MACTGRKFWVGVLLWALVGAAAVFGQSADSSSGNSSVGDSSGALAAPPATVEAALHAMSDAAEVIFAGRVVEVRRVAGAGGASGVMVVTFQIDSAVRGCAAGETYVLREWTGLWSAGDARYRVGQRLLMLLRAPNAAGISSPVGGRDGAIPIRGAESAVTASASGSSVSGSSVAAESATAPLPMVDLRWVGARVLRSVSYAGAEVSGASAGSSAGSGAGSSLGAAPGASVDTVVGLLGSWEAARAAR